MTEKATNIPQKTSISPDLLCDMPVINLVFRDVAVPDGDAVRVEQLIQLHLDRVE